MFVLRYCSIISIMLSRAAERSSRAATKEGQQQPREAQRISSSSHIYTDQRRPTATAKRQKVHRQRPFSDPHPNKKCHFRLATCGVYAIYNPTPQHISCANFTLCVDYRPTKSSLSFFCHAVTPCVSRVCRVLCRNVDFLLTYTEKKIIRLYNKRER